MKSRAIIVACITFLTAASAHAGNTYTPAQLSKMIEAGRYPKQGNVTKTVKSIVYAACILNLEKFVDAIKPPYPAETIASTDTIRTDKLWTNDAAMTVTCLAESDEMVITIAPYL